MFRCGEGYILAACSSSCFVVNKIQKGRQHWPRELVLAIDLEVVPSFRAMVFRCGEGYVLAACSSSCFVFNKIQKGRQHWMDWIGWIRFLAGF